MNNPSSDKANIYSRTPFIKLVSVDICFVLTSGGEDTNKRTSAINYMLIPILIHCSLFQTASS